MNIILAFSLLLAQMRKSDSVGIHKHDPEEKMNVTELIRYHGYPVEEYDVQTEDGYILYLFRIPYGKNNSDTPRKATPVYFQHGLLADSSCWVFDLPHKTLPFLLADLGYDIYLGNFRGGIYGRRHKTLNPHGKQFWQFSFDELGKYDLPAIIDFILKKSAVSHLHYIGHSMGTTSAFVLLSTKKEYNAKVRSFFALSPVAKLDHCKSPFVLAVAPMSNFLAPLIKMFGGSEFLPHSKFIEILANTVCESKITNKLCSTAIFLFFGIDYEQFNETRLPVYMHFFPVGASVQNLQHYAQVSFHHRFQNYDYVNPLKNLKVYGQFFPPEYDLTKITTQVALYYGDNDWLAHPLDVKYIAEKLPRKSLVLNYRVPFEKWNHVDFLTARDVVKLLYNKVIETLETVWPE